MPHYFPEVFPAEVAAPEWAAFRDIHIRHHIELPCEANGENAREIGLCALFEDSELEPILFGEDGNRYGKGVLIWAIGNRSMIFSDGKERTKAFVSLPAVHVLLVIYARDKNGFLLLAPINILGHEETVRVTNRLFGGDSCRGEFEYTVSGTSRGETDVTVSMKSSPKSPEDCPASLDLRAHYRFRKLPIWRHGPHGDWFSLLGRGAMASTVAKAKNEPRLRVGTPYTFFGQYDTYYEKKEGVTQENVADDVDPRKSATAAERAELSGNLSLPLGTSDLLLPIKATTEVWLDTDKFVSRKLIR